MKFIHLADAHLDSPFLGLSFLPFKEFKNIKQTTQISFTKAVDDAIDQQVDLFLIAGDTFDSIHPSPQSQLFLNKQIKRLTDAKIQVVMILGNHDYIDPVNLLLPKNPYFKLLGQDEKVENFKAKTKSGFEYRVVGFSYRHNHIVVDKVAEFPEKVDDVCTFGLMHAAVAMHDKSQDNYAPFSVQDLKNLNYNYFALGHIHLRQILSQEPLIAYSGNLQGRHINEAGKKGYFLGNINEDNQTVQITFKETAPIIWQTIELILNSTVSQDNLISKIKEKLTQSIAQRSLLALKIKGAQYLTNEQRELIEDNETWMQLSDGLPFNSKIVKVYLMTKDVLQLNESDAKAFNQAKKEILTNEKIDQLANVLIKKSKDAGQRIHQADFYEQVKELAQVKLGRELKDFNDETN